MANKEFDIFISYNSKDLPIVREYVTALTFFGVKCWFQINNSKQEFGEAIVEGFRKSANFVVFLSVNSARSFYVNNEINYAVKMRNKDNNFKIVPVIIDDIDLADDEFAHIDFALGALNMLNNKEHPTPNGLALKIIDQLDLKLSEIQNKPSIYSAETDVEIERLKIQNRYLNRYAVPMMSEIFKKYDKVNLLDVGCSNPDSIKGRIGPNEYSTLLGVDIAEDKIKEANERFANEKDEFLVCDITDESKIGVFQEYFKKHNIEGFNVIHISSVLLHLKEPAKVLSFCYKLLVKGGTIFIQDEDDGLNISYPKSTFFKDVTFLYAHSLESGDREMGRKLPIYLKSAGFKNIVLLNTMCSSTDFGGEYKEELWDLYFNPDYWAACDVSFFDDARAEDCLERCRNNHAEVKTKYMEGDYYVSLGIFFYSATK